MSKARKLLAPALLTAIGLGAATPALAHDNDRHDSRYEQSRGYERSTLVRGADLRSDIWQLDRKILRAESRRTISRREASGLTAQTNELKRLYGSYIRNGLSDGEYRTLKARVDRIDFALRAERRDRDGRRG